MTQPQFFPRKYIWGSRDFEEQLKAQRNMLLKKRGINLEISTLTQILAEDMKNGHIILDPQRVKFRRKRYFLIGGNRVNR